MGIHYDYKSTRNEKAMKKEAKRKARIEEKRAKKGIDSQNEDEKKMHDLDKPITLEDLTNPDKDQIIMSKVRAQKDAWLIKREIALKSNLKKRKKFNKKIKKNERTCRQMD